GVGPGDVVGIMTFNVPGFVFAAFGAWYLGATVVPVNHKMQAPEVAYTIDHSGARLGIVSAELAETARAGAPDIPWLETESDATDSFDARLEAAEEAVPGDFTDEQVAQILYTSGTTSAPKGCVHTHRSIAQVATLINLNMGYRSDDRYLVCMPIWHSAPLNICLLPTIQTGGTVVLQRSYHPVDSMTIIAEEAVTTFFGPTGGLLRPEDQLRKAGSVGRTAMIGNAMRVVKADGTEAGPGETGEIWFSGDTRMREYLGNPEATAAAFEGEWYRTGDIARLDEDGFLFIVDRSKDIIIVGGENVYSLE